MMMAPQVVGVLLKKPGQQGYPRVPPLDSQETKIRGELYVEDLGEKRVVSIRMGWLWVEGTPMRLALRALNLRQAAPSVCRPHVLALGFTLSNLQGDILTTFWADTEPIYWSWVRAIAAELVRQTPFRAQRCLNFLEILTICPRGPMPLPESPAEMRRRSRSELRYWLRDSTTEKDRNIALLNETRRRTRSELRGWSSNSSDEDLLAGFRNIPVILPKEPITRAWGCSESSEGSDDSLPWGGGQSSVDSVDSVNGPTTILPEPDTREQRIQRYKEARRKENEARSRRVLEEDARRRKARSEENNNNVSPTKLSKPCHLNNNNTLETLRNSFTIDTSITETTNTDVTLKKNSLKTYGTEDILEKPPAKSAENCVRFEDQRIKTTVGILKQDSGERRSRARERRSVRERGNAMSIPQASISSPVETLQERKDRLQILSSRIPLPQPTAARRENSCPAPLPRSPTSLSIALEPCEESVAKLLERCQRVDHYVPVRDKLTLFESLSRLGCRLARSTEDLGRAPANPSPKGKQRARSLHDLNRSVKAVPVREMCRFFEGDKNEEPSRMMITKTRFSDPTTPTRLWNDSSVLKNDLVEVSSRSTGRKKYFFN